MTTAPRQAAPSLPATVWAARRRADALYGAERAGERYRSLTARMRSDAARLRAGTGGAP